MKPFIYRELDLLLLQMNESNSSLLINKVKDKLKGYILSNKEKISTIIPEIISYLKTIKLPSTFKKEIVIFITTLLISLGQPVLANNIKDEFQQKTEIAISNDYSYEIGEYQIPKQYIDSLYKTIKDTFSVGVTTLKGTIEVSISDDPQNPENKNFANNDTPSDKLKGGNLLNKRVSNLRQALSYIQNKLKDDNILMNIDITIIPLVKKDRTITIKELQPIRQEDLEKPMDNLTKGIEKNDRLNLLPSTPPTGKDISGLSRNYQFVELLSIVGIDAKRFNNTDISKGDAYSTWVANTRKSIKSFLGRLSSAFPEYNITFNKDVKISTPIKGAMAGMSKTPEQYTEVREAYNGDSVLNKWKWILGITFPGLTAELADKFEQNIESILNYLEQMYGSSLLEFRFEKQKE